MAPRSLPDLALPSTDGTPVNLATLSGWSVVYAYPRTSPPNAAPIEGWDQIPGARGCTPQSCAFRDHHAELLAVGFSHVFGISTQSSEYQVEMATRLHLPFAVLSDELLLLARALGLDTFDAGGMTLLKRTTLILHDGAVVHQMLTVDTPTENASDVISWATTNIV